ncbi:hypothetical protein FPV67DRAFT_1656976 [Lyophyllum atratum]|nr:hypothetical protein FPV67DRAFT_1656976 [Lyophyllum atratum]
MLLNCKPAHHCVERTLRTAEGHGGLRDADAHLVRVEWLWKVNAHKEHDSELKSFHANCRMFSSTWKYPCPWGPPRQACSNKPQNAPSALVRLDVALFNPGLWTLTLHVHTRMFVDPSVVHWQVVGVFELPLSQRSKSCTPLRLLPKIGYSISPSTASCPKIMKEVVVAGERSPSRLSVNHFEYINPISFNTYHPHSMDESSGCLFIGDKVHAAEYSALHEHQARQEAFQHLPLVLYPQVVL